MAAYLVRRIGYGLVTMLGVLFLLFVLFFAVTDPDDIARKAVGERARPEVYAQWKKNHGYDKPLFLNTQASRRRAATPTRCCSSTIAACSPSISAAATPTTARSRRRLREGAGPSLSLTVPLFVFGLVAERGRGAVRRLLPRDLRRPR